MLHTDLTIFEVVNNASNKKRTEEKVSGALEGISQKQRSRYS